jgi:hypothetical protein
LAALTYQAISAQKPTPMNPDTAGWTDSRRTSRQIRISAATTSAVMIAGSRPNSDETGTKTTTGSDE